MGEPLRISKKQKIEEYCGMNELPDEALILILSHMPLKAAATTSVLSRRWEMLWTFHPSLVFDGSKELLNLQYQFSDIPTGDYRKMKECLYPERVKYIHWVNHILESHHAPAIQEFKIRFDLNKRYQSDIDEWVRFAFGKQVKIFELDFPNDLGRFIHDEDEESGYYKFCTRTLGVQSPISLTSLVLKQVNVSGEVLENLISNCPFLERLCVVGSESLVHLRVAAPSLCLTHLNINHCAKLEGLELNAPNLVSLTYSGPSIKIRFTKDPNLTELYMGGSYVENCMQNNMLPLVPRFAAQLQKLGLIMYAGKRSMQTLQYPLLNQVKQLELRVIAFDHDSLLFLSSLIEACPSLNHLALEMAAWLKSDRRREAKKVKSHHDSLKEVVITGFVGRRVDTEFAKYLIKSAVRLERMSIDPLPSYIKGTAYVDDEPKRVRRARKKAEKLRSKYGLEDKLVIL